MRKRKQKDNQEKYAAGYNINHFLTRKKNSNRGGWKNCVNGLNNAEEDHAYSCYINATFQLLASNTSFVREVLDFMVSHKIILTTGLRKTTNNTNESFDDELEQMKQHPTLSLFLLMMKICRVLTFHHDKNIDSLVLKFYLYIIQKLRSMNMEERKILYPLKTYESVEPRLDKLKKTQDMEDNISYMLPVIIDMMEMKYNNTTPTLFFGTEFKEGSELVSFLEYLLQNMKMEIDKHIVLQRMKPIANPVDVQYRLAIDMSVVSGSGEEVKK